MGKPSDAFWNDRPRTHCRNGHALTGSNKIEKPNGWVTCRRCKAERGGEYRQRNYDANAASIDARSDLASRRAAYQASNASFLERLRDYAFRNDDAQALWVRQAMIGAELTPGGRDAPRREGAEG